MSGLEVECRYCQAMQALLPLGSGSSASGPPLQAAWGTHPEGRVIPMGHTCHHGHLGFMPVFLATGTCHHAQDAVGYLLHPLFSSRIATQALQAPLSLPFLALVCRDWEIPLLQQTPEDRAWQKNPLCNPVYLLLPPCTEFNQTPWGFTHFQLQILS